MNQRDIISQTIKVLNNKDINIINNEDDDYIYGALTVDGGGVFKKGIAIGIQDRMVPGLMIYDHENFYGFSEKYGLSLLSTHPEYNELSIPDNIFENRNTLQPVQNNTSEHFKNLKDTEKVEYKSLNIDLEVRDINNFYIIIPKSYSNCKFILSFNIKYIYDLNTIISNISLVLINESDRIANFKIINNNIYFEKDFNNDIEKNSINKISCEVINENYFIITKKTFVKDL